MSAHFESTPGMRIVSAERSSLPLAEFIRDRVDDLRSSVLQHGAVLFRGFHVPDAAGFQAFIEALKTESMDYKYKSTPRTRVDRDIFTATEYPRQLEIPMHCENAYQRVWPMWISLCCITPASAGGQTPIASMRKVTASIDPKLLRKFADRGVKYIRHYRPYVDLQWQDVFQTKDRSVVAKFCRENGIHHRWLEQDVLRTEHVCQGTAAHPVTSETFFFNQAHLFHASSLDPKAAEDLIKLFGADRLPRHATYGDGEEISISELDQVRKAFASAAIDLEWRQGDVVVLDNMQFAHGRRKYAGDRRVLASLLHPHHGAAGG